MLHNKVVIEITNFKKFYHRQCVLSIKKLSFYLGYTYLIVGENGSGKSTLIKAIIGLIKYEGYIKKEDTYFSYLPERFPEFSLINVMTFLKLMKIDDNISDKIIYDLCDYFNLDYHKLISNLSKGNLQKVMIIQAIINNQKVMIFDEPLNGLDLDCQNKFLTLLKILKNNNRTIIITTHYPKYYVGIFDLVVSLKNGEVSEIKADY